MTSCSEICGSEYAEQSQGAANSTNCQQYGVRSYLHQFYEECTASIWERDEDFQIQRSPSRWSSLLWKVCLVFGTLILATGLVVLLIGYATPARIEAFGEDELLFIDSHAVGFNRALDVCKLTGAVLFCVGGAAMATGLLLSAFAKSYSKEELYLQQKFKERLAGLQAAVVHPVTRAPGPGEAKVPVTLSKVQSVQPTTTTSTTTNSET